MASSKKKLRKRIRRQPQPQTYRGHHHQSTHTVQELRDHGHAVLIFNQNDKRALGAGLGASLGAMLGLVITDNPGAIGKLIEEVPKFVRQAAEKNPGMFDGMFETLGMRPDAGVGAAVAIDPNTVLFDIWSSKEPPVRPDGGVGVWFERRDVAIWRTAADGMHHAFALAFDGPGPSACGKALDVETSMGNKIVSVCGECNNVLAAHGYKPPRVAGPPPPADVTPGPRRRPRARKAKAAKAAAPASA